jgi:hypothetical protein
MVIGTWSRAWVAAAILGGVVTGTVNAQSVAPEDRVLAAVDVEIVQRVIDADGSEPWPAPPPTAFTLQKLRTPNGSTKVVLTYRAANAAGRTPAMSHPLDGARVEYESSGALSVFDRGGTRRNPRLSTEASGASMGPEWLDQLVLTAAGTPARRLEVERAYGRAVADAGRLRRYRQTRDGVTEDVLVDPAWGVPVEVTRTRQDGFDGRVTFEYGPTPSGNLVRRAVRSERVIDTRGRRAIVAMQLSNVRAAGW